MGTLLQPGEIPDKLYFKIGEVCQITGLKSHTLRFWESEFKVIRPKRANSNQRLYRRQDVEVILKIKQLIQEEGRTLAGTRKYLAREKTGDAGTPVALSDLSRLQQIKNDLHELQVLLNK